MVMRFLQAIGSSAGLSVGSGVIGDIYKLEERYLVHYPVIVIPLPAAWIYKGNCHGCLLRCSFVQSLPCLPNYNIPRSTYRQFSLVPQLPLYVEVRLHSIINSLLFLRLTPRSSLPKGLAAHYASWRDMQFALLVCGLLAFLAIFFFLPETSHPLTRGIDKARMMEESSLDREGSQGRKKWKWVWVNPLASLWLLRSPNLLAVVSTF